MHNAQFTYDPDTHTTVCTRTVKNKIYTGVAKCHPQDWEFESTLMGQHYSYLRSMIHEMSEKREELRHELRALYHMQSLYDHNNKISKKSYECCLLRRQIKIKELEIAHTRGVIRSARENIRATISLKDKFYHSVREERKKSATGV